MIASLGDSVELLGFGEALHGGENILILRNRLFQRLVEAHGYSAIAIESSFPRAHVVNEYVAGRCPASYEAVRDTGFSHGFGKLDANRELVEWMRAFNADPSHRVKLQFYGFDSPTEMIGIQPWWAAAGRFERKFQAVTSFASRFTLICWRPFQFEGKAQWVWNLRLEMGQKLSSSELCTKKRH